MQHYKFSAPATIGAVLILTTLTLAAVVTVTVAPGHLGGWTPTSTGGASVAFEVGPGSPPMPIGSAEFRVGADGDDAAQLRNNAYAGTGLSQLTALGYSTYVEQFLDAQAPYIILNVDYDGDLSTAEDLLFFEPAYQNAVFCSSNPQSPVLLGTWQTWDALNGCWWSVNGTAGANPGSDVKPLSAIIADQPNARIASSASGGGVRLVAGFGAGAWDNFVGNVDAFNIGVSGNTTSYNFEPYVVATQAGQCKNDGWQTLKRSNGSPFKNQGDCVKYVNTGK